MARVALVVDDSMLVRHAVCRFLEERGFQVETAASSREALDMLPHLEPSLIVTELDLLQTSGAELIAELRVRPQTANTPIIVLTTQRDGGAAGEAAYPHVVCKDIDMGAELRRVLDNFELPQALGA